VTNTPQHREEHEPPDTWPEHEWLNRAAPFVLVVLGLALLLIGWRANRDPLAIVGFASLVAGVLLPRVEEGVLKIGPGGVETPLRPTGPSTRTRIQAPELPPGEAVTVEVEADRGDDVVSYTERIKSNELLELWGSQVLPASVSQGDWWVFANGPDLPQGAWKRIDDAPDIQFVMKHGGVVVLGHEVTDKGEAESRYRFLAKGADGEQAIQKVRGVLEPYVTLTDWDGKPVTGLLGRLGHRSDQNG
jgi:hypothetical protein